MTNELYVNCELSIALINNETYELSEENRDAYRKVEGWVYLVDGEVEYRRCELTGLYSQCYLMASEL